MFFHNYIAELYPDAEIHQRWVRPNDILAEEIEHNGATYRVRVFDGDEVVYWCKA